MRGLLVCQGSACAVAAGAGVAGVGILWVQHCAPPVLAGSSCRGPCYLYLFCALARAADMLRVAVFLHDTKQEAWRCVCLQAGQERAIVCCAVCYLPFNIGVE